ncbi:MAG: nucleotide exchange factor GrpE [Lachnospiraceae bacterium]|nr:nucleotide exchange factor GrpE [Lachnospiraceae bacterium]
MDTNNPEMEREEEILNGTEATAEEVETEAPETEEAAEPEAETEAETETDSRQDKKEKKKKEKKDKKDKRDEQIAELQDRVLRQQAEFINFRNRTEKEKTQMFEVGAKSILEKILPVVDNLERGLAMLSEEQLQEPFAQGMDKIYKQLMQTLTDLGVTPLDAVGKEFDPELHNAVMHVEDESLGENVVAEELQKGYRYHESVLRHSMVKVAN